MDAKCRWHSDRLDGTVSFREPLGQTKVMQICQGETLNHQGAITHEVCCLAAQLSFYVFAKDSTRFLITPPLLFFLPAIVIMT